MQGIGADGVVGAEHVLGTLKLDAGIGDADDRGLQENLILKRDKLRRAGLQRPDVQHVLIPVHVAVEIDLGIAVRVQIGQPDMCVEAGRVGHIRFFKAGVEDIRALLDAQDKRLLVVLIPDTQQLNCLRRAAAVQVRLAAADDLGADALEAVERDAVVGDLRRDGILCGKLDRDKGPCLGLGRDRLDGLRVGNLAGILRRRFCRDDADGDGQHLRRVGLGDIAEIGDIDLKLRRQLRHGDGPAVRAGGDEPVGQRDCDCIRCAERGVLVHGTNRQRVAAGGENICGKGRDMHGGGRLGLRVRLHGRLRGRLRAAAQQRKRQCRGQHENQLFHSSSFWEIATAIPALPS